MNREKILELVREFAKEEYSNKEFIEGKSAVPVSGRVFDEDDIATLVDSALDFHLTTYRYNYEFEKSLRDYQKYLTQVRTVFDSLNEAYDKRINTD